MHTPAPPFCTTSSGVMPCTHLAPSFFCMSGRCAVSSSGSLDRFTPPRRLSFFTILGLAFFMRRSERPMAAVSGVEED